MSFGGKLKNVRVGRSWIGILLFAFALSLLSAVQARADDCVADRGGVIDGFVNPVPPSQINIDGNCTIRNFPASNPLTSNISFFTSPGQNNERWLIIFDNVVHTGQMSCNSVLGHHIWFTNGSSSGIHANCQNLLIPVEKIDKRNPAGQTTATIGVPFTYTLTIPVLWDPATGSVINTSGSVNDLHSITVVDDLNATGVSLSYVSHTITWLDDGTPVPHTFSNVGGVLTFDNFPIVTAGRQFVIALTVVLNDTNNTPPNVPGTQFINTAKWDFGRLIDGTFYEPLPGEWGVTPPLTIAAPVLNVTKSGPATMNLAQWGNFAIDVQNVGLTDAWNASLRDLLPNGPTGGMCTRTPEILSAQVFAADGVTPIAGKGPLSAGSDYSLSYSGAPSCQLDITMLTAAGRIGPNERLILRYRTQLDAGTQNGITLTNIAGVIQWFNGDSSNSNRVSYTRTLTNGTVGILDHEDAHTVTTALTGYFFDKTVMNLTSGANPATTAAPGDRLRYTLRFQSTDQAPSNFRIYDEMDALNSVAAFAPGTLTLVSYPAGADISGTNSTGGAKGTGILDVRNLSLPVNSQLLIQFDITLKSALANSTVVTNQATASLTGGTTVVSDDPNVNGTADPLISGDEDPTRVTIVAAPVFRVQKISTDLTGDPNVLLAGETLRYTITVKNIGNENGANVMLRDAVPANTTYVAGSTTLNGAAVADVAGLSPLVNGMLIHSPADPTPGSMPADPSASTANVATITFNVVVNPNTPDGTIISNQGFLSDVDRGIVDQPSDDPNTPVANDPTRNRVGNFPLLYAEKKVVLLTDLGSPGIVDPGDTLRYTITVQNSGAVAATGVVLTDGVPANTTYVANSTLLNGSPFGQPDGGVSPLASGINVGTIAAGTTATLQFDLSVNAGTPAGTLISNQAVVSSAELPNLLTDGDGNPATGPEPTVIVVGVSEQLSITKQVTVVGGGPAIPGATLEYIVSVTNIAATAASYVIVTDNLDASQLIYVNGSATMNGSSAGVTFSGSNITANYADGGPLAPGGNAVLRFRATLASGLVNGTVVTNTGVVTWNRPAQTASASVSVVIGLLPGSPPSLFAAKRVALFNDLGTPNIVDPGDTLRYTITVQNLGATSATGVALRDAVPANTTYVANSTLLNGAPAGQPDGGVSPLASGINVGAIPPGATVTLQFDVRVNAGTPAGTLISNQGVVSSAELPNVLTDGDGNPATGPEPTVIVVGVGQQLSITKQVTVVGGGIAVPGAVLEYVVNATNIGTMPALAVVVTDDLNASQSGQLAYVSGSATMNGSTSGISVAGSVISANYGSVSGPLAPGASVALRFRAILNPSLPNDTVVTNTGMVAWNNPIQTITASASVSIVVGSLPGFSVLNGSAWHDANFNNVPDAGERPLAGWTVELYRNNQLSNSVLTDAGGAYRFFGIQPNDVTGVAYELRFRAPGAGANTALLGVAASAFTNGLQRISNIIVSSGANLQGLNLPIHPNGVVYNSLARTPITGATLTLLDARSTSPLPASCFDDAAQQGQITLADGYYKFDINFSDPACPSGGDYLIGVTAPSGTNYVAGLSQIIPPTSNASTAAFSVPACPASSNDAIPSTAMFCEVQTSEFAPALSVPARSAGTTYQVHLVLDGSQMPGTSQIFNNHIPLDPQLNGSIAISKTTSLVNVTRGQLVPYTITVNNVAGQLLSDVSIVDRIPAGFTYVQGSALLDGVPAEPSAASGALSWNGLVIAGRQVRTVKLLLAVSAGVTEGEYVNRAQAVNTLIGSPMSGEATATVRVMPDPTFDCTDVTGKVFNDANRNGLQDNGEQGLPGVRVVTARGLQATTDQYGRYHITCAITPNESRGSNFVLKLDDRTLPSGFRLSTDPVQIKRVTRGKSLGINFGASIYRVVGIDLSDAVFEPGTTDIRIQWRPRLDLLLEELRKAPAILRLSYVADTEDAALVEKRMEAIKRQLTEAWGPAKSSYMLTIEPEVFWRRGAPPKRPDVRVPGSK